MFTNCSKKNFHIFKWKFDKAADPLDDTIWVESDILTTYMELEDGALWISNDCREHLECSEYNGCETDFFVVKLADPKLAKRVGSILFELESRREAINELRKDPFAIVDRDIRISELEELLKKNKIRVPKK